MLSPQRSGQSREDLTVRHQFRYSENNFTIIFAPMSTGTVFCPFCIGTTIDGPPMVFPLLSAVACSQLPSAPLPKLKWPRVDPMFGGRPQLGFTN